MRIPFQPAAGQADAAPSARIPPGLAEVLLNMEYRAGAWSRRRSAQALHATQYPDPTLGAWGVKQVLGGGFNYQLFSYTPGTALSAPSFLRLVGSALVAIPFSGYLSGRPEYDADNWWRPPRAVAPDSSRLFAARYGSRGTLGAVLHNVAENQVTPVGIPAPTACAVTNSPAATSHPGGVYEAACYTFITDDGAESSASPLASVTMAAGDIFKWTLQVSSHPRVTGRRLYLPLAGAGNLTPYIAFDVPNNTATNYDLDILDEDLGDHVAPTRNGLPPEFPEDVDIGYERLWVVSNDGIPAWWYSEIDDFGPAWEAFSNARRLSIPSRGGRRAIAVRFWAGQDRMLLLTDSSGHKARPTATGFEFEEDFSSAYGVANAHCVAISDSGVAVGYDGRVVWRSDGGPPEVISRGWVDRTLSKVPAELADRACLAYIPESGRFCLSLVTGTSGEANDLCLVYDPASGNWNQRGYFWDGSNHSAPTAFGYLPAGAPTRLGQAGEWITAATFPGRYRVFWLESPSLRDEGPISVHVKMLSGPVPAGEVNGGLLIVSRVALAVTARKDVLLETVPSDALFSVRLLLDGNRYTSAVQASRAAPGQYAWAPAQNLGDPAAWVQVEWTADVNHLLEVFDQEVEARRVGRTAGPL